MKVAIVGSRSMGTDQESIDAIKYQLDMLKEDDWNVIISGGAKGVDSIAKEWAVGEGIDFILYKPYHLIDTKMTYTPRFFFTRNKQIVDNADKLIIFWDGISNGTRDVIRYAQKRGKPIQIITLVNEEV